MSSAIRNFANDIINGIGSFFTNIGNGILTIIDYLNPLSENFFVYKLIELLGDLLKWLFIPKDDYFSNIKETLLSDLQTKLPYQDYLNMFSTILDISDDGQMSDIKINNYKVGNLNINMPKFIDFSVITQYRVTWYGWVRGFIFIFLIIYHVNQISKFLRGFNITDGSIIKAGESMKGGQK